MPGARLRCIPGDGPMSEPGQVPGNAARRGNRWRSARVPSAGITGPEVKRRAISYSLWATAMAMSGLVLGAAPASASIHNTPGYVHIVNSRSGKCIDLSYPDDSHSTDFAQQW